VFGNQEYTGLRKSAVQLIILVSSYQICEIWDWAIRIGLCRSGSDRDLRRIERWVNGKTVTIISMSIVPLATIRWQQSVGVSYRIVEVKFGMRR
jgi:hypothetical protein